MSFSADWLALREGADHRARSTPVRDACTAHFAGRETIAVLDLGAGSGSTLRALAPYLPARQTWTLVDHAPDLLEAARERLLAWANTGETTSAGLTLRKAERTIAVRFLTLDFAGAPERLPLAAIDLVTASALFDLASRAWIERLAALLALHRKALLSALTYDGVMSFSPPHPDDEAIGRAFNTHQSGDKGFGPAAGADAAGALASALRGHGFDLTAGQSDWDLGPGDAALIEPLAAGIATAVGETAAMSPGALAAWAERTRISCRIGHTDLFAAPP